MGVVAVNIFYLDPDPSLCAEYHNDKHVVKMILESAQLLCGSHWLTGKDAPYKLSHKNHPCSIWVRESISNYDWLCELGLRLCSEYSYRYDKVHKTSQIIDWCCQNKPKIPNVGFTEPALAMPESYKIHGNPVQSYRNYYIGEKYKIASWKNRKVPFWFQGVDTNAKQ